MNPPAIEEARRRRELAGAARRLPSLGLTQGTSGNLSMRLGDGLLITPSAVEYDGMEPDELVALDLDGTVRSAEHGRRPSTEWRLHAAILRTRHDVQAVVHAHPPWATALACLRRDIPPFHYMVAVAGGSTIRCADYATFGTEALADAALAALGDRRACLLANHGIVACAESPGAALDLAVEVEALAGQYLRALSAGEPVLLSDEEMGTVRRRFGTYGRREDAPEA